MILTNKTDDCFVALDFFGIWIHIWNTGFCPVKKIFSLQMFFYLFLRGGGGRRTKNRPFMQKWEGGFVPGI